MATTLEQALDVPPTRLRMFDVAAMRDGSASVVIGARNTGKSYLIRDLLRTKNLPAGALISHDEGAPAFYGMPATFVHEEYDTNILGNVLKRQALVPKDRDRRAFAVMDHCMFDNSWTKDENVRTLVLQCRPFCVMFILALCYPPAAVPAAPNMDYVFILRENNVFNRKRLFAQYAERVFPDFEFFCQVLDESTDDFHVLVIDNTSWSRRLEDVVFWYRAGP